MKRIVILGSGAAGTMCAAKLRRELGRDWKITIIDNDEMHHYQPGWLFIPFGIYTADDCRKPKRDFIPKGVEFVLDDAKQSVVTKDVRVLARNGRYLTAAFLSKDHYDNLGPYLFFNKLYV